MALTLAAICLVLFPLDGAKSDAKKATDDENVHFTVKGKASSGRELDLELQLYVRAPDPGNGELKQSIHTKVAVPEGKRAVVEKLLTAARPMQPL